MTTPTDHWQRVWSTKTPEEVSWTQPEPRLSLRWIDVVAPEPGAALMDAGGGASVLVDHLLDRGHRPTVLDLAGPALAKAQERLGARADNVWWVEADATTRLRAATTGAPFDVWHDRAVFHFLTDAADREAYVANARRLLRPGGHAIVATFAPDGPEQCSGLDVCRYDGAGLAAAFGDGFELVTQEREEHTTPWGSPQAFQYVLLRRV
ncbi:MAG: class I SAM-dependent methyltransferase [Thermoplasmatota archaeon]